MGGLGDAYIRVHADTDPFNRELEPKLATASTDAEKILDQVGHRWGDKLAESTSAELGKHGHDFARAVEDSTIHETIRVRSKVDYYNVRDSKGRFTQRIAQAIERDVEEAFTRAAAPGGVFSKIGSTIADAIGAGFNVSGRSGLITLLIPVIGSIVGLVVAAIEAVNLLIGLLVTLPGLIAAIGLQVGTLAIVFHGLKDAITGAFQAKNAKELHEAIKDLTPAAREFVVSLLPLKGFFHDLARSAQQNFFGKLGNVIDILLKGLGPTFFKGIVELAGTLGWAFHQLAIFLASPVFRDFLSNVFARTISWLQTFTPEFVYFLTQFFRMAHDALPFLTDLGQWINHGLFVLANLIDYLVTTGQFKEWLASLKPIMESLGRLFGAVGDFLFSLLTSTDKAGGKTVIDTLADALERLAVFFSSPAGVKALEGFIDFANASIAIITGLVVVLGLVAAAFDLAGESIKEFFRWLGYIIEQGFKKLGEGILWVVEQFEKFWDWVKKGTGNAFTWIKDHVADFFDTITGIPDRILDAVKDFGTLLWNAGKNLIGGLIKGVKDHLPDLKGALGWISDHLPDWKGPYERDRKILEPSGRAVMSGFITGINSGASDLKDVLVALTQSVASGRYAGSQSVNFGRHAIQINFLGLPTEAQALQTGMAVGAGINHELDQRSVALAVRSM